MFGARTKAVIGIDIGADSIKLIALAGSWINPQVVAWGSTPLKAGAFSDSTISDPEATAEALHRLMTQSGARGGTVALSISSAHAITKVLAMPKDISDLDLEEQVSIEALQVIPYPIDEVNIDFEVIGPSAINTQENDVLLVACRRSIVDEYIALVKDAGLRLSYVDIDTYALERVYRSQNPDLSSNKLPTAMFDIGSSVTHLLVLDGERVLYTRHQNFGASNLIKLICKEYGLPAGEAEQILHSSQFPDDFKAVVEEPFIEMLRQEVSRALQFFYSSSAFSNINEIVLSGACCSLTGLAEGLQAKLRTKVSILNPLANARVQSNRESIKKVAPGLAIAYGLSLRGLS